MHITTVNKFERVIFISLFVVISLFIFRANDKSLPFAELLNWQYAVPCLLYAGLVVSVVAGFTHLLRIFTKKRILVIGLSVCLGTIMGLKTLLLLTNWIFR